MFLTPDSGKVLFTLICVVFSCFSFSLISCDAEESAPGTGKAAPVVEEELKNPGLEHLKEKASGGTPESMREYIRALERELEKLSKKYPQATIKDVRIGRNKKNMDIDVTFSIKNRKGIKSFIKGYLFYRRKGGGKFEQARKNGVPIFISREFTPENVTETRKVEDSMPYADLNVGQPRDLRFDFYIY